MEACYNACADLDNCHFYVYDFITKECDKYAECIPTEEQFNSASKAIYQEQCNLLSLAAAYIVFEHIVHMRRA